MANWTTIDFPPLSHDPSRHPLTHSTRPVTYPTRSLTHPPPSILGNPPPTPDPFVGSKRGGSTRGGGGGSRWGRDGLNERKFDNVCEKFHELEVIAESFQLAKNSNDDNVVAEESVVSDEIAVEATGENVPKSVTKFEEISELGLELRENIKRCKYVKPTVIQCHAIPILMAGRDLMACAQTGSGKTAAFCFPIIAGILKRSGGVRSAPGYGGGGFRGRGRVASPVALIMAPTRELTSQIHDEAKKFAKQTGVKVVVAYGGTPMSDQLSNMERGVDILVATPGRLVDLIERGRVSLRMIRYFALDEADRMLDMGFEPQIRKIAEQMDMPATGSRQTMLFSATFPTEIQRLASDFLSNYIFLTVGKVGSSNDMIKQKIVLVNDYDKENHLKDLLLSHKGNGTKVPLTIVFAETKRSVDGLAKWLSRNGFPATAIHGDKIQQERERALRSFKNGTTPIIVATDVAARGLDIPCVAHVINYDLPRDIEHYVHRIGRTGRAGKSGLATAFFSDKDRPISKSLVELMEEASQEVPDWLSEYAHSSSYGGGGGYGGRRHNRGGGKFGGRDYRNFDNSGPANSFNDNYSSSYSDNYSNTYTGNNASSWTDNNSSSWTDNNNSSTWTENYSSTGTNDVVKPAYTEDYSSTYVDEVPKSESFGGGVGNSCTTPGYEAIVATGWD